MDVSMGGSVNRRRAHSSTFLSLSACRLTTWLDLIDRKPFIMRCRVRLIEMVFVSMRWHGRAFAMGIMGVVLKMPIDAAQRRESGRSNDQQQERGTTTTRRERAPVSMRIIM